MTGGRNQMAVVDLIRAREVKGSIPGQSRRFAYFFGRQEPDDAKEVLGFHTVITRFQFALLGFDKPERSALRDWDGLPIVGP